MSFKKVFLIFLIVFLPQVVLSCDLCGCFIPRDHSGKGLQIGFAEQYSSLTDLYGDGEKLSNEANQYMKSSYSQLVANYHFSPRTSLQVNVPLIHRSFQRIEEESLQRGSESGIGDLLVVGAYVPFQRSNPSARFTWKILGGLKFPTGSSDRIAEELEEGHHDEEEGEHHDEEISGVHGHDLALGSGSWDGLIGTDVAGRAGNWFYQAHVQYAIRTRGDFDYKFANDLIWYGGPGYFLASNEKYSLGLQAVLSGEHKGADELGDHKTDDTAITTVYLAPTGLIGIGDVVIAEVGLGFPLSVNNEGVQAFPKYRLKIGLTWQFQ